LQVWVDGDRALEYVRFFLKFSSLFWLIRVLTSHKYSVFSVAWSPDGKQIASGGSDTTIKIWDSQSGDCQSTMVTRHSQSHRFISFKFVWFSMIYLSKKGTFSSSQSHWHSQQEYICFVYFPSTSIEEKILLQRVPPQRRLAISRLRVPNFDGFVITTAGNLLSIGAPRHRPDPEITRSQHTNQQKQKGKNLKKNLRARVPCQRPGIRASQF